MFSKALLREVILSQKKEIQKDIVPRTACKKIEELKIGPWATVVMGVRRSGKSTLLKEVQKKQEHSDYFLDFDDDRLAGFELKDFQVLMDVFVELFGVQNIVYFDEIQNIDEWEKFIRRLHNQEYKIYISGSNAKMLSKELGTRLTGRYIPIEIFPFSFKEYVNYKIKEEDIQPDLLDTEKKAIIKSIFSEYMDLGGFPEYFQFKKRDYLHSLYETILYRDIITRHGLTSEKPIKQIAHFLAGQIGKEMTYNSIRNAFGIGASNTVANYCQYLEETYLFFFINKLSPSLKVQERAPKKVYCVDHALSKALGFRMTEDKGRLLENMVYIELRRRYKENEIFYHKAKKECDFIIKQEINYIAAIQVCLEYLNHNTEKREITGLLEAMTTYNFQEGYILTEDYFDEKHIEHEGKQFTIKIWPVWYWALKNL